MSPEYDSQRHHAAQRNLARDEIFLTLLLQFGHVDADAPFPSGWFELRNRMVKASEVPLAVCTSVDYRMWLHQRRVLRSAEEKLHAHTR